MNIEIINAYNSFSYDDLYEVVGENFIYNDVHYNSNGYKIIAETILNNTLK